MAGDGKDGGDGVESKDDVGQLNGDESKEEDGGHPSAIFDDEKVVLTEADGVDAGEPANPAGGFFRF